MVIWFRILQNIHTAESPTQSNGVDSIDQTITFSFCWALTDPHKSLKMAGGKMSIFVKFKFFKYISHSSSLSL